MTTSAILSAPTTTAPVTEGSTPARRALRALLTTEAAISPALARLTLALVFFPHGAQKVLGWFGGYGLSGTYGFMTGQLGIPGPAAALAIATEFLAPLALLLGLLARPAAAGIAAIMVVATLTVHLPYGFFMNWSGSQAGEGFEYHLLALALSLVVVVSGAGRGSLDGRLARAV